MIYIMCDRHLASCARDGHFNVSVTDVYFNQTRNMLSNVMKTPLYRISWKSGQLSWSCWVNRDERNQQTETDMAKLKGAQLQSLFSFVRPHCTCSKAGPHTSLFALRRTTMHTLTIHTTIIICDPAGSSKENQPFSFPALRISAILRVPCCRTQT
jgi:hypothetical protein